MPTRTSIATQAQTLLDVPDAFRETALAFPSKVEQAVALLDTPEAATDLLNQADTYSHYARRIKADTEAINSIQYGKLLIIAKLGQVLPDNRGKRGNGKSKPPLPFSKPTLADYRKVGKHAEKLPEYRQAVGSKTTGDPVEISTAGFLRFVGSDPNLACKFTGDQEWYTPAVWIEAARTVMGGIDLDPASCDFAQETVQAERYYTINDDGLTKPWLGNVWLNPPYQDKHPPNTVSNFVNKLCDEYEAGSVQQAILLVNNVTDTRWCNRLRGIGVVAFAIGRIAFYNQAGDSSAPPNGQMFWYLGDRADEFRATFEELNCWTADPQGTNGHV